ncbi:unnamed protein product, partial [Meganyctiphanes norvegica]
MILHAGPLLILLFSGKRKSGKDYITDLLHNRLRNSGQCVTIRISGPIKKQYAADHNLDYEKLLTASDYKEQHRLPMITWSEAKRAQDAGYFIRAAIEMYNGESYPIWIVSDMRRRSDLKWFKDNFNKAVYTIRITATEQARRQRGWIFTHGVDDAASECDLDNVTDWDQTVDNSTSGDEAINQFLDTLSKFAQHKIAFS